MIEDRVVWLQGLTGERWTHVANTKAYTCPHGIQVTQRELYMYDDDEMQDFVKGQHKDLEWAPNLGAGAPK